MNPKTPNSTANPSSSSGKKKRAASFEIKIVEQIRNRQPRRCSNNGSIHFQSSQNARFSGATGSSARPTSSNLRKSILMTDVAASPLRPEHLSSAAIHVHINDRQVPIEAPATPSGVGGQHFPVDLGSNAHATASSFDTNANLKKENGKTSAFVSLFRSGCCFPSEKV